MSLQSIKYKDGNLEILDQLLLPVQSKYLSVKGVEDGWKVINKMQVINVSFQLNYITLSSPFLSSSVYMYSHPFVIIYRHRSSSIFKSEPDK